MRIKTEDIVAYEIDGELFHPECFKNSGHNTEELTANQVVTNDEVDEDGDLMFCNHCKCLISPN